MYTLQYRQKGNARWKNFDMKFETMDDYLEWLEDELKGTNKEMEYRPVKMIENKEWYDEDRNNSMNKYWRSINAISNK